MPARGCGRSFALSLALCLLSMADRLIALWGEHLKAFEHDTRAFWYLVRIVVVVVTVLTLLEIWGADLTAILLAMGILTLLAILVMRDIGPDLVAGVQVSSARHFGTVTTSSSRRPARKGTSPR